MYGDSGFCFSRFVFRVITGNRNIFRIIGKGRERSKSSFGSAAADNYRLNTVRRIMQRRARERGDTCGVYYATEGKWTGQYIRTGKERTDDKTGNINAASRLAWTATVIRAADFSMFRNSLSVHDTEILLHALLTHTG